MSTLPLIPKVAWISLSPDEVRTVSLLCFLLQRGTAFTSTMFVEMLSFKIMKFVEFVKGYIVDRSNMLPDGPVKIKDLQMGAWVD
jgi:hypothetical protein